VDLILHKLNAFSDISIGVVQAVLLYAIGSLAINIIANRIAVPLMDRQRRWVGNDRAPRLRTLSGLIRSVAGYVLKFVTVIMLLRALRFDAISVISTASFAGLAFGFGAQKLVKDVISGFFIIIENQYDLGDYVTINGITGRVEEIGMRIMQIRDDTGKLFILSNGDISQVCNQSRGPVVGVLEIGIVHGENVDLAGEIIDDTGKELTADHPELGFTEQPRFQGVGASDATHVVLRVLVKVKDPSQLGSVQVAMRTLLLKNFLERGIAPG